MQIVTEFKDRVRIVFPGADIYFYGSRVTGKHREDSDYDLLVVLGEVNSQTRNTIYDIAWEIGFAHDVFISPVLAAMEEFTHMTVSPFYNNVKQHGWVL